MKDFDLIIGPDLTITLNPRNPEKLKKLLEIIPCSEEEDSLPESIHEELKEFGFAGITNFLNDKGITKDQIDIEEEWDPWVSKDQRSLSIGLGICVGHNEDIADKIEDIFYSSESDHHLSEMYTKIISVILSKELSWIEKSMIKVEVNGIGQG